MKRKKMIVANWKMNPPTLSEARRLAGGVKRAVSGLSKIKVIICPPFIYLPAICSASKNKVSFGSQDVFWKEKGAYTGEVSPRMIKDVGAKYTIIGHSERRALGETNEMINRKIKAALKEGLSVILCIGEKERGSDGSHFKFLQEELLEGIRGVPKKSLKNIIVAYEPIWAIGRHAKDAMKPEDMHEMAIYIKKVLAEKHDKNAALSIPILYGGSAEPSNTEDMLRDGQADGLLVGHASLNLGDFKDILHIANKV